MGDDFLYNILIFLAAITAFLVNMWSSKSSSMYWWCNPNGFMAIPMFLSSAGFSIFYIVYGRYPELYGVENSNIALVNGCLVVAMMFYTVGTFVNVTPKNCFISFFGLDLKLYRRFEFMLGAVIILLCIVMYASVITTGQLDASTFRYGENQWSRVNDAPWLRLSVLLVPVFAAFVVLRVSNTGKFPWLSFLAVAALIAYPAIKSGGRKDVLFVALIFIIAYSLQKGKAKFSTLVISALVAVSINYVQVVVRENFGSDSDSVASIMASNQKEENGLVGQISTIMPIAPTLSSAMIAFPSMQNYGLGSTYFETALGTFVPKIITEEFNYGSPNQKFHQLYYPEVTDFSMDYSMAAESYQNFGVIGIFFIYFIFGVVVSNAFRVFKANRKSLISGFYVVFYFSAIWSIRSDSNTFLKTFLYPSLLLFMIYVLAKYVGIIVRSINK